MNVTEDQAGDVAAYVHRPWTEDQRIRRVQHRAIVHGHLDSERSFAALDLAVRAARAEGVPWRDLADAVGWSLGRTFRAFGDVPAVQGVGDDVEGAA